MKTPKLDLLAIIPLLPQLSQRELTLIRAAADHLLKNNAPASPASPLYDALLAVAGSNMPFSKFQGSRAGRSWPDAEKQVVSFMSDTWGTLNKVTERALMFYLVEMLAADLVRRKLPVTVGMLASSLSMIPQVVDAQFPGYRAGGAAGLILKKMVRK
jgi:hypothetical protein